MLPPPFEDLFVVPEQFQRAPGACPAVYRLCTALLEDLFVARRFAQRYPRSRYWQDVVAADRQWLAGAVAQVPFPTACDLLGLAPTLIQRAYFAGRDAPAPPAPAPKTAA